VLAAPAPSRIVLGSAKTLLSAFVPLHGAESHRRSYFGGTLGQYNPAMSEGRLGTAYVVAAALSILILSKNRYGRGGLAGSDEGRGHHRVHFDFAPDGGHAGGRPARAGPVL